MSDIGADASEPLPIIPPFELNVNFRWQHLPLDQRVAIFPRWVDNNDRVIRAVKFAETETKEVAYIEKHRMRVQQTLFDHAMRRCMTPHSKLNVGAAVKRKTKKRQGVVACPIRACALSLAGMQRTKLKALLEELGCHYSGNGNPRKTYVKDFSLKEAMKLPRYKLVDLLRNELLSNSLNVFEQSILQSRAFVCRTAPWTQLTYPPGSLTVRRNQLYSSRDLFLDCPDAEVAIVATARLCDVNEFETDNFYQMHRLNLPDVPDYYDRFHHNKSVPLVVHNFPLPKIEVFDDPDKNGQYGLMLFANGDLHSTSVYCSVLGKTEPGQLDRDKPPTLTTAQEQRLFADWRFCDYDAWSLTLVSPHARFQPPLELLPKAPFLLSGGKADDALKPDCMQSSTVVLYGVEFRTIKKYVSASNDKYVDDHDSSINCRRLREQDNSKLGLELALVRYMPTGFPDAKNQFMAPMWQQQVDKLEHKRSEMYNKGKETSSD